MPKKEKDISECFVILLTDKMKIGSAIKAFGQKKPKKDVLGKPFATDDPAEFKVFQTHEDADLFKRTHEGNFWKWRPTITQIGSGPGEIGRAHV